MKKIGFICLMTLFAVVGLSSCSGTGGSETEKAIADKIENGEKLTSEDYSHLIAYVGEYAEDAQQYVDMEINEENLAEAKANLEKLNAEYPYLKLFRDCLKATPMDALSEDNIKEIEKYAGLIEFTTPDNFTIQTDANAAGLEVAVPDSANGVLAGAVDSVKVKR